MLFGGIRRRGDTFTLGLDDALDFHRWRLFAALARSNFLKLCQIFVGNSYSATTMAPDPISPEEARRRNV